MRASFAKVDGTPGCEGVKWAVKVSGPHALHMEGTTVEVQKRDGSTQTVNLGSRLATANGRDAWYTFQDPPLEPRVGGPLRPSVNLTKGVSMGMRAQVMIEDTGVYLYTHWGAESLPDVLATALDSDRGRSRWDDPEYLARIIFDFMLDGDHEGETGFGIGTTEHFDLEYPAIRVNCREQTVEAPHVSGSFETFIVFTQSGSVPEDAA